MTRVCFEVSSPVAWSPRVAQVRGIFDVPENDRSHRAWSIDMPLAERPWNVGLIVGPSGSGKSTLARRLWPAELERAPFAWRHDRALVDDFPEALTVQAMVELLSSVGFSSPPSWEKPFHVLSNGEQFRVGIARLLAESPELAVVDEFTSVVDRTVAQIGSHAIQKTVRRRAQRFVAVTCHEDVEEWLQPDWVCRPAEELFIWRSVQPRPRVELEIARVHSSAWELFKHHHYLTAELSRSAWCFVAFWRERPVAFTSWLPFVGKLRDERAGRREHRTVCLPDYQGIGIGNAIATHLAACWRALGMRAFVSSGHPAIARARAQGGAWRLTRKSSTTSRDNDREKAKRRSWNRLTCSLEYVGEPAPLQAALRLLSS